MTKRAIVLGGGGPGVGLPIGVLKRFGEAGLTFDVWALSGVGAWVGVVYNQHDGDPKLKAEATYRFFWRIFQDEDTYSRFPVNTSVFSPDMVSQAMKMMEYCLDPKNYRDLYVPGQFEKVMQDASDIRRDKRRWNRSEFSRWSTAAMAANPFARFAMGMFWQSNMHGLARRYYPAGSEMLDTLDFKKLAQESSPFVYHNAWNLSRQRMDLFANKVIEPDHHGYLRISRNSLCACTALPFIEDTVNINDEVYCEGAVRSPLNFERLLEDHSYLDEIWIVRLIDVAQLKPPRDLTASLENLIMLSVGGSGADSIELFHSRVRESGWKGTVVEVPVSTKITFDWTRRNLDLGCAEGYAAASDILKAWEEKKKRS